MVEQINKQALECLANRDWKNAQFLFKENIKQNPCHQTFNNLGYFLITEGLELNNGKHKSAVMLGHKYLLKAAEMKETVTNIKAITESIFYQLRTATKKNKKQLFSDACQWLKKASKMEYHHDVQYNFLMFSYLLSNDSNILFEIKDLIEKFENEETVSLYFCILLKQLNKNEGNHCIDRYGRYISDMDKLMFYTKTEQYEKGYAISNDVYERFSIDKFLASALIEICINTNHFTEAEMYAKKIFDMCQDPEYAVDAINGKVFGFTNSSSTYRKKLISSYECYPIYLKTCCYFGCSLHENLWF